MDLVLYITVSWLVINYFITNIEKYEIVKDMIIYMILIVVSVSINFGITINLELIKPPESKAKFLNAFLHMHVMIPFLILIFISKINVAKTYLKKIVLILLLITLITILEFINIKSKTYTYIKWNYFLSILLNSFYIFMSMTLDKGFQDLEKRGELNK